MPGNVLPVAANRLRLLAKALRRAPLAAAILCALAPLAQSAEHFHGKEGVYGSSP